jgi:ribosomal-protein-alanine N-acetyltransferase
LEIENESNPFPWTEGNFQDCLDKGYYSLALEDKNKFIGFAIMAISTDESHLLNIGINKNERGMGYGEKLLRKMIIAAEVMGSRKIILEVRLSNKTAYQLYKKLGFEEIGIRKKYYRLPDGREDAYVLSKSLKQDLISKFFFSSD